MISINEAIGGAPLTISDLLDWPARLYPARVAIANHVPITYAQLRDRSIVRSKVLANFGVRRFQRWGLLSDDATEFFISLFALARVGAVVAPIRQDQLAERFSQTANGARLCGLIAIGGFHPASAEAIASFPRIFEPGDNLSIFTSARPEAAPDGQTVIDVDPALIIWSSGSTRLSRGVVLQHRAVLANIRSNIRALELHDSDRTLVVLPVTHAYALIHQCLCHLAIGATLCYPPLPLLAPALGRYLEEYDISTLVTVPPVLKILVEGLLRTRRACPRLRLVTVGAGRASFKTLGKAIELLPHTRFAITYGLTEAGPRVTTSFVERGNIDPACVGVPLSNVEIRLERLINGAAEISIRGSSLMRSYADEPWEEGTDHLLTTSDIGEISNGKLCLAGRLDRAIKRGGVLVAAERIEEVLLRHPAVERACVEARPHSFWGEVPAATLALRESHPAPSPEELRLFCARWLSPAEIPPTFEVCETAPTLSPKDRNMLTSIEDKPGPVAANLGIDDGGFEGR